jgi:phage nucleotide-binding protein
MAISLKRTSDLSAGNVKMLVYGQAGAGKTSLIPTLPNPVVLSAEGGLLSISGSDVSFIEIGTIEALHEAYQWAAESEEAAGFESVCLDSISEIGETVLAAEMKRAKDPRQAYGEMQHQMGDLIRAFRDLPGKHVYCTAKLEKAQDEQGRMLYSPSMPGNKTGQALPYFFDEVLALRVEKDAEGVAQRALQCDTDGLWQAKDRSGRLDMWELPDLGTVIGKIRGEAG